MATIVGMLDIDLGTGSHIRVSTVDGVKDELNAYYTEGLKSIPSMSYSFVDGFNGIVQESEVNAEIVTIAGDLVAVLRATDVRSLNAVVRYYDLDTNSVLRTFSGVIQSGIFTTDSSFVIRILGVGTEIMDSPCPKMVISGDLFGSVSNATFDLNLPIPIVLGATREGVPCRYVEESQLAARYRYTLASDLRLTNISEPLIQPRPNAIYQSFTAGPFLVGSRNAIVETSSTVAAPPGPTSGGTFAGTLNGAAGTILWVITALNGIGETESSGAFANAALFTNNGQYLVWTPSDTPQAVGFRFYRSVNSGSTYGLIKEIVDPTGYQSTQNGTLQYILADNGLTVDSTITPPAVNTTQAGLTYLVFNELQYGASSQLVPIFADVEFTECAIRSDTLGLWLFRDREVRDISAQDKPKPTNKKMRAFWDFRELPTGTLSYSEPGSGWTGTGVKGQLWDRMSTAGENNLYTSGTFTSTDYVPGVNSDSAVQGVHFVNINLNPTERRFCSVANSGSDMNLGSGTAGRIQALVRPHKGSGALGTMTIASRGSDISGTYRFAIGVKNGRAFAAATIETAGALEVVGTSAVHGEWHEVAGEITREGTGQGIPPIRAPEYYAQATTAGTSLNSLTLTLPMASSADYNCCVVGVTTRDTTGYIFPSTVTINGQQLLALTASASGTTGSPYITTSLFDGVQKTFPSASYPVVVTYAATVLPKSTVVCAASLRGILPSAAGQAYRDTSAKFEGASKSPLTTLNPLEAQNKTLMISMLGAQSTSTLSVSTVNTAEVKRQEKKQSGTYALIGAMSSLPEVVADGASQIEGWNLSTSKKLGQVSCGYTPLGSVGTAGVKADYLVVFVDGVEEGRTLIPAGAGRMKPNIGGGNISLIGSSTVLQDVFDGDIDHVLYICPSGDPLPFGASASAVGGPWDFGPGKTGHGLNSLVFASNLICQPIINATNNSASLYGLGTANFTVEAWIKPSGAMLRNQVIYSSLSDTNGFLMGIDSADRFFCTLRRASVDTTITTGVALVTNLWHLLTAVVLRETAGAAGSITLYTDGRLRTSGSLTLGTPQDITHTSDIAFGMETGTTGSPKNIFLGLIDEIHVFAGLRSTNECKLMWGLGTQNVVSQIQALLTSSLHGPGITIDQTSFNLAATLIESVNGIGGFRTAYTLVEQQPLSSHLAELLRVRGLTLAKLTDNTAWTITCDALPSPFPPTTPSAVFAIGDGQYENMTSPPSWNKKDLKTLTKDVIYNYRVQRDATGAINSYGLKTAKRDVASPKGVSQIVNLPAVRDRDTADRVSDYLSKRLGYEDKGCSFETGLDGLTLRIGDLINVQDPETLVTSSTQQIVSLETTGTRTNVTTVGWASALFTYGAKLLPVDILPEASANMTGAIPLGPTNVIIFSSMVSQKNRAVVSAVIKWTPPVKNYNGAKIWYREPLYDGNDINNATGFVDPWRLANEVDTFNSLSSQIQMYLYPSATTHNVIIGVQAKSPHGVFSAHTSSSAYVIVN